MLNLDDMKVETTVVKFNDEEFIIDPDIPFEIVKEMQDIGGDHEKSRDIFIKILSLKNDSEKARKFITSLGMVSLGRVANFISNFIFEVMRKKE